jgi:hypothetical protein
VTVRKILRAKSAHCSHGAAAPPGFCQTCTGFRINDLKHDFSIYRPKLGQNCLSGAAAGWINARPASIFEDDAMCALDAARP